MTTTTTTRTTTTLVALLAVAACRNPNFCEGAPENNCALDAAGDAEACTTNAECTAPTPVCDGTCVECTAEQASACTGTAPTCGDDRTCRACASHADCASRACLPDGSCGDDTTVAYVDPGGTDTAACTRAMPCTRIASALATARAFVKLAGTTDEAVVIAGDRAVTILADPGARLTRTSIGVILEVKGNSQVAIFDLEISDGLGATGVGISMPTGNTATLALAGVTLANNTGGAIAQSGGSQVVTRSTLAANPGGGLAMTSAGVVVLTNSFVHHNGNPVTASSGGLALRPTGASKVELNTIVDNQANIGAASAGGVFCDVAGFVAANNLVFRNTGGATGTVQTFGNCTYGNSFVMPGATTVDNTPGFASPNSLPFDYHLTPASPPTVRDAAGACTGEDFDRQARPSGAACELGADELTP